MVCGLNLQLGWDGLPLVERRTDARGEVHLEDASVIAVRLLPVLPPEAMRAVLRAVMIAQGWSEGGSEGVLVKTFGAVVATLAADGSAVEVRASARRTVTAGATVTAAQGDDPTLVAARLQAAAEESLTREQARVRSEARRELLAVLAAEEGAVRGDLQRALNGVYRTALERRAREIGEVESVREDGDRAGDYEVTVVVRA